MNEESGRMVRVRANFRHISIIIVAPDIVNRVELSSSYWCTFFIIKMIMLLRTRHAVFVDKSR